LSAVEVSVKVLLATDAGDFADSFSTALRRAGCEVEMATTADDIRTAAGASELVFLDLELAGVDSLAILTDLQETKGESAPPVVLLKGEGEPAHVIQRGLDLGAAGYVLKHRVPRELSSAAVMELLRGVGSAPGGSPNRRKSSVRPDACPYSAPVRFAECAVFLPVNTSIQVGTGPRTSCSHLRAGTVDTWRLYPRCALGDENTRAKYLRDQTA
jgi:DNA-binding response OmpR family regulator